MMMMMMVMIVMMMVMMIRMVMMTMTVVTTMMMMMIMMTRLPAEYPAGGDASVCAQSHLARGGARLLGGNAAEESIIAIHVHPYGGRSKDTRHKKEGKEQAGVWAHPSSQTVSC